MGGALPRGGGRAGGGGGARRPVKDPPLVLPLRDGVRAVGVRSAGRRSPRVLAEQQQIPPHSPARRGPLLDAFGRAATRRDRKSTRLNSSHGYISYAVFCLKKKNKPTRHRPFMHWQQVRKTSTVSR